MPAYTCICSNGDGKLTIIQKHTKKTKLKSRMLDLSAHFFFTYLVCNINLNSKNLTVDLGSTYILLSIFFTVTQQLT